MECSTESEIRSQQVKKTLPKFAGEMGIPIRHYNIWETMEMKHVVYEELSILGGCHFLCTRGKVDHFCHTIHKDRYGSVPVRLWQVGDQICSHLRPFPCRNI